MKRRRQLGKRFSRDRESGQAAVEFAIILVPLLVVVGGIIWFGIGLNYWLSMNRIANQGARWAAVNNWPPQCPRGSTGCTVNNATCASINGASPPKAKLQDVLRCQSPNNATASVCYPGTGKSQTTVAIGDPVKVRLTAPYTFFFFSKYAITLKASATMRLEQRPDLITGEVPNVSGVCP